MQPGREQAIFENILVGIDGGPGGRDAIALARQLAGPGATLALAHIHVHGPGAWSRRARGPRVRARGVHAAPGGRARGGGRRGVSCQLGGHLARAMLAIGVGYDGLPESEEALAVARDLADRVECTAVYGGPREELARFSRDLGLLVVGSCGYRPWGRMVHGSVGRYLIGHAACPLLVLARGAARVEAAGAPVGRAHAVS